ncbi:CPBP family intramembrane glutamic endopeptidase [Gaiella sp.]|uniref:CPBP family intramembrane glutamic endopeptidase n=1 Tax=Gaiella sp. TaxID=2663207 RepID=UPI003983C557
MSETEIVERTAVTGFPSPRRGGRLLAWGVLIGLLALASYGARLSDAGTPSDVLYLWSTFVGALIQYAIMFILILAIARGTRSPLLALRRPEALGRAALLATVAFGVILVTAGVLGQVLDAGDEQGLVPDAWDSSRAVPFVANALVVVLVAPFVEELLYRGLGMSLLLPFVGPLFSIGITGLAFGLAHGLVLGLPVLTIFGITLGWLRWKTDSVYPGMVVHGIFNGAALIAAVAV